MLRGPSVDYCTKYTSKNQGEVDSDKALEALQRAISRTTQSRRRAEAANPDLTPEEIGRARVRSLLFNVMNFVEIHDTLASLCLLRESLRERRDPEGAFVNTFDPGLTENDDIRAMTLTMAIEMIARKADAARRSNTSQFGALVSNTDRDSPGTHWFAVAYEIAPADPTSQVSSSKRARR